MSKKLSPQWKSIEDLSRRASIGESDALISLSKLANEAENDDEIEFSISSFDEAAMLYAIGKNDDMANEWQKFRQVIEFSEELDDLQMKLADLQGKEQRLRFVVDVLEEASATTNDGGEREHFLGIREINACALQFVREDILKVEVESSNAKIILKIAKKKLSHPRFSSLPDNVLDELIEAVGFELKDFEDGNDEEEDESDEDFKDENHLIK